MQNLRDKLMKAGLVTEEQSKQAEVEKVRAQEKPRPERAAAARPVARPPERSADRRPDRPPRAGNQHTTQSFEDRIPKLPPLALPGSKAFQRLESLKQVELDKRLRELARSEEVLVELGEHAFHFVTRKGRLRRLALTPAQAKLLEEGQLAVVESPEPAMIDHCLVPRAVAEKMELLSPKSVRFLNRDGAPVGFLTDAELLSREAAEASGQAAADEAQADHDAAKKEKTEDDDEAAQRELTTSGEVSLASIATPAEQDEGF